MCSRVSLTLLLLVLYGVDMLTALESCMEQGSGCRTPFGLATAYENLFTPVCHKQSICYSCGASAGFTKQDCDRALQKGMYEVCAPLSDPDTCRFQADNVIALQIRVVGTNYFHTSRLPESWCVEHGVEKCLPSANVTTTATVVGK